MSDLYRVRCGEVLYVCEDLRHVGAQLAPTFEREAAERVAEEHDRDLRGRGHEEPLARIEKATKAARR